MDIGRRQDMEIVQKIEAILKRQIAAFWDIEWPDSVIRELIGQALIKTEKSFVASSNKYFILNGFSVYNSVQYSIFLYFLSNIVGKFSGEGINKLADPIYYLNKIMNGVDWYWQIELPEHFIAEHPIGTVLGRAKYGDYLFVYQGVTIGGNRKNGVLQYPELKGYTICYANSTILGEARIGNYVIVSSNAFIKDEEIPDYSIVFGSSPSLIIKKYNENKIKKIFSDIWCL